MKGCAEMAEEKFEPGKAPAGFDPSKAPPMPKIVLEELPPMDENDVLHQKDPLKWLRQPPKVIRGDMKKAFQAGRDADSMTCNCWNRKCPFFGNCRKCIAFHMALTQIPTCQREMVIKMYREGILYEELYIKEEEEAEKAAQQ